MEKRKLPHSTTFKTGEWIKCQSKQRPDKYYMFNKETGETRWCSEFDGLQPRTTRSSDSKTSPATPLSIAKTIQRTPAQDRLKRLQNSLTKEQKEKTTQKQVTTRRRKSQDKLPVNISRAHVNDEQKEDVPDKTKTTFKLVNTSPAEEKDYQPSTSKSAPLVGIERDKPAENSSQKIKTTRKSYQKTTSKEAKKRSITDLSTTDSPTKRQKRPKQEPALKEKEATKSGVDAKSEKGTEEPNYETKGFGSSFVNKFKTFFKDKLNSYYNVKKVLSQKHLEPCIKKTNFKIPKKVPDAHTTTAKLTLQNWKSEQNESRKESEASNNNNYTHTAPMTILMKGTATPKIGEGSLNFKAFAVTASPSQLFHTPNKILVPAYQHGSANARLENLRSSLSKQIIPADPEMSTPTRCCPPTLACVVRDPTIPSSSQSNDEDEPMDWLPTEELKPEAIGISNNESISSAFSIPSEEAENMGDYYCTVNENLLRYAVEQKHNGKAMTERWRNDCYYFVLDTNVLIEHLTFLEELTHMKLCDTSSTILYVPYCVLQELDKLKQFSNGDGTKVRAVRAIKYLNAKFEAKSEHLQAQSALRELEHLIEITSPDDRIINCCLQVKQHIDHFVLLTEDINLRNKAICNNISVSTRSDLISKHS